MSSYRDCFRSRYGEQGKRRHSKTRYCKDGYETDSQTGERLTEDQCVDADKCAKLRHSGRRPMWERPLREDMI